MVRTRRIRTARLCEIYGFKSKTLCFYIMQISAIKGMVESQGGRLNHVKPHGALYNDSALNEDITRCIYKTISVIDEDLCLRLANTARDISPINWEFLLFQKLLRS